MSRQVIEEMTRHAKLLCVSRPGISVDYVAGRISGSFGKVIIHPQSNATDIARLIKQGIESLNLEETVSKKIVERLIQGANGMFLWAYLMLRHISQLTT